MPVLYRDYRPQIFSEVIDQDYVKSTLQNAAKQGSFAHAYLFTGPRGTGKTTLARIFARAINCLHPENGEPDNKCEICKQFLAGKSLDLIEIDAASNTGVENIRDIIEHLKFSPAQAKYKVFIIDEVHMLSKGAFNALLKTLEEPPAHAIFVLATTEVHKVPATVISRTQRFDFHKLESLRLFDHLKNIAKQEKIIIDDKSLQLIVNASEGSGRDALSILDKLSSFGKINLEQAEKILGVTNILSAQKLLDLLCAKDAGQAVNFLEELFEQGVDPVQFNKDFLEYLRKVLMSQVGVQKAFALDQNQADNLQKHAAQIPQVHLLYIIRLFLRANKDFETSPSLELPLEIAAAEACTAPVSVSASTVKQSELELKKKLEQQFEQKPEQPVKLQEEAEELQPQPQVPQKSANFQSANFRPITFDQLKAAWPEILQRVKANHSSLLTILKTAKLVGLQDNCLTLGLAYKFHKDSLDNKKNGNALLQIITEHFDTDFSLNTILEKEQRPTQSAADLALEVFGGEMA